MKRHSTESDIQILNRLDIDQKDIRCIQSLYWNQMAEVRVGNDLTEARPICRGVRQGWVLSPLLFYLYSEAIFQEALQERNVGVKVYGSTIFVMRTTQF